MASIETKGIIQIESAPSTRIGNGFKITLLSLVRSINPVFDTTINNPNTVHPVIIEQGDLLGNSKKLSIKNTRLDELRPRIIATFSCLSLRIFFIDELNAIQKTAIHKPRNPIRPIIPFSYRICIKSLCTKRTRVLPVV